MMLASAAVLACLVPAAPAGAGAAREPAGDDARIGIRLVDIPVARLTDPRARNYIIDHLKPGATIDRRIEVHNASPESQHVEFYPVGATVENNTFTALDGRGGNELSGWVSAAVNSIDLPPGAKKVVKVKIAVPGTASAGERYAAVLAQVARPPTDRGNVGQVHRVGVRIYLNIGPGGEPPTDFSIGDIAVGPGPGQWPVVTAQVRNTGRRAIDMSGNLSLSRESGSSKAGPFRIAAGVTVLPGQVGQVSTELNEPLSVGRWHVQLELTSGTVRRTAEGTITLPVPVKAVVARSAGGTRTAVPVVVGAALVGALLAFLAYRRHRRSGHYRRSGRALS
ncbi:hypothetical protein ABT023_14630 [Micromonospora sp. NPDC002296]|uniref:hypothetical protein n=1 Tax=Micromonospora sp. NPDC002296 TaxID=3154271 RepID=UPI00331AB86C